MTQGPNGERPADPVKAAVLPLHGAALLSRC